MPRPPTIQGGDLVGGESQLGDVADLGAEGGQALDLVVGDVHHTEVGQVLGTRGGKGERQGHTDDTYIYVAGQYSPAHAYFYWAHKYSNSNHLMNDISQLSRSSDRPCTFHMTQY